jgi:hypothetical protein
MVFNRILCAVDFSETSLERFGEPQKWPSLNGARSARLSLRFATRPLFHDGQVCRNAVSARGALFALIRHRSGELEE